MQYNEQDQERFELNDQIILIEKLIAEKKTQITMLYRWLQQIQGKSNEKFE
jgi:hypothetical protein